MALALYRKYRPRTFGELIGQDQVTVPLMQALRSGRLNHAYLFSGAHGCGKTSSARILARSLNCEKGPTPEPCGDCESCRALAPDGPGSIDVIEIDAASHGGVDDARELRERAYFAPAVSRFKIYIIDEAHMVSPAGFNALLKLVEEPPDYVKFVFATTEPEKVLGTIKSRTHHYPFRLIPPSVMRPYLEEMCQAEGVTMDPKVLPLVVRAGGGFFRDTLSVLDQLMAGAGPEGITYARAVSLLGVTDAGLIDDLCDALAADDAAAAFATIERIADAGHDPRRFTGDLLERLRDLILLRQVPDAIDKGLFDAPADQLERMQAQAQRSGPATLTRWADIVHNGLVEMRGTTSTRLLLELITARLLLPTVDSSDLGVLSRLERLEQGLAAGPVSAAPAVASRPAAPAAASTEEPRTPAKAKTTPARKAAVREAPARETAADAEPDDETPPWAEDDAAPREQASAPVPAQAPAEAPAPADAPASAPPSASVSTPSGEVDAPTIRRAWDEIVQMAGRSNKRVAAIARDGVVRDVEGSTIVLVFKAAFHANSVNSDPGTLLDAIHQVVGGTWQLRCEVGGDQRAASGRPASGGGGRSPAGKAEGSPPPVRSASPAPVAPTTPAAPAAPVEDWPETAPIGGAAINTEIASEPDSADDPRPAQVPTPAPVVSGPSAEPSAVEAPPKIVARQGSVSADDEFGPLDEPPYDPEYDGHIEDTGSRGPSRRPPAPANRPASAPVSRPVSAPVKPAAVEMEEPPPRNGRAAAAQIAARAAARSGQRTVAQRIPAAAKPASPQSAAEPGFDPGDEPTDEVLDAGSARQSVEQQAVEALRQRFGLVEKIADL